MYVISIYFILFYFISLVRRALTHPHYGCHYRLQLIALSFNTIEQPVSFQRVTIHFSL